MSETGESDPLERRAIAVRADRKFNAEVAEVAELLIAREIPFFIRWFKRRAHAEDGLDLRDLRASSAIFCNGPLTVNPVLALDTRRVMLLCVVGAGAAYIMGIREDRSVQSPAARSPARGAVNSQNGLTWSIVPARDFGSSSRNWCRVPRRESYVVGSPLLKRRRPARP